MTKKKRFIARTENWDYIIDKRVRRDKKSGDIRWVTYIPCSNIKPKGAVKFYEDEKAWLEKFNTEKLVWIEEEEIYDGNTKLERYI